MPNTHRGTPDEIIPWLLQQDREKLFEVKEYRSKRSLTQNAYYWVLNDKLAARLRMPRDELHELLLKRYAPCEVVTVLKTVPIAEYFKYAEVFAEGTMNGKEYNHVRIYKGSSQMDSAEFARLLDGIIDECHGVDIETMTPEELARLEFIEGV